MKAVDFQVRASPFVADKQEWLVYAIVPSRGGDGALIAVYDDEIAAYTFAKLMNSMATMHQGAALA
jgi:hypothetical protein